MMLILNILAIFENLKHPHIYNPNSSSSSSSSCSSSSASSLLAGDESLLLLSIRTLNNLIKILSPYRQSLKDTSQNHPELRSSLGRYRMDCQTDNNPVSKQALLLSDNLLAQMIQSLLFFCSEKGVNESPNPYGKSKEVVREALNALLSVCLCCHADKGETGGVIMCIDYILYVCMYVGYCKSVYVALYNRWFKGILPGYIQSAVCGLYVRATLVSESRMYMYGVCMHVCICICMYVSFICFTILCM